MADMVQMKNPTLPDADPATVSREAFDEIWEAKGFQIVGDDGELVKPAAKTAANKPSGGVA